MAVTDRVTVMRRGEMVRTFATAETTPAELAELMVGRRVLLRVEKAPRDAGRRWCSTVEGLDVVDAQGVARLQGGRPDGARRRDRRHRRRRRQRPVASCSRCSPASAPPPAGPSGWTGAPLDVTRATNADDRRAARHRRTCPEDRHRRGLVMPFAAWENAILGYQHEPRFRGPAFTLDRRRDPRPRARGHRALRRPPAVLRPQDRQLLRRQPAEDRHRPRDRARPRGAARRPADARRRHRRDRVHPPPARRAARRRQGDPARLGRARRDPGALPTASS